MTSIITGAGGNGSGRLVLLETSDGTSLGHLVEGKQNNWHAAANLEAPEAGAYSPPAREISTSLEKAFSFFM